MFQKVKFQSNQVVTQEDYDNLGAFPRDAVDKVFKDAITDEGRFVAFAVVQSGVAEVEVGAGRLYRDGKGYFMDNEGGVTIDLLPLLPAVTRKIVSIVVFGNEVDANVEPRTFLIDPVTRATQAEAVATESRRAAFVDRVAGGENVDPQPPAIPGNVTEIARVLLDTNGIVSITMIDANRLLSVKTLGARLTLVEQRLDQAGSQIETLRTDISAIAERQAEKANMAIVVAMMHDLGRLKLLADLPSDFTAWDADNFEDDLKSDTAFAGYDAVTSHGLRFGGSAEGLAAFALLNDIDDRIRVDDDMVTAKSSLAKRISVVGKDSELALATYQVKETELVKKVETRTVFEWTDPTIPAPGEKTQWSEGLVGTGWQPYAALSQGPAEQNPDLDPQSAYNINVRSYCRGFIRTNPDTGVVEVMQFQHAEEYDYSQPGAGVTIVTEYWRHGTYKVIEDVSWKPKANFVTVQGYQAAGTFLNSQSGTIGGINLFFTRKAAVGDVRVIITEVSPNGEPNHKATVVEANLAVANINADPAGLTPTFVALPAKQLEKGKRYAFWVVTQGAHWLATISGEKYAQGAAFVMQNDAWNQLGVGVDIPFELYFHQFADTRVVVPLEPVTLAGGMRYLEANFDTVRPEGTDVRLEAKTTGDWFQIPFADDRTNPLLVSPTTVQLRVVLLGTTDDMPKFGIGPNRSCVTMRRYGTTLKHVSDVLTLETDCDTIEVRLKGYAFDSDDHSVTVKILTGATFATVETADVVADVPAVAGGGGFHKSFQFTLAGDVDEYRVQIEGTTSDATKQFVVTERVTAAWAA